MRGAIKTMMWVQGRMTSRRRCRRLSEMRRARWDRKGKEVRGETSRAPQVARATMSSAV